MRSTRVHGIEYDCTLYHQGRAFTQGGAALVDHDLTGYWNAGQLTDWHGHLLCHRGADQPHHTYRYTEDPDWIQAVPALLFLPHGRVVAGAHLGTGGTLFRGRLLPDRYTEETLDEAWDIAQDTARYWVDAMIEEAKAEADAALDALEASGA